MVWGRFNIRRMADVGKGRTKRRENRKYVKWKLGRFDEERS